MTHKNTPITALLFIMLATLGLGCQSTKKITGGVNIGQEQLIGKGATELPGMIYIKDFQLDSANYQGDQGILNRRPLGSRLLNRGNRNDAGEKSATLVNSLSEALVSEFNDKNLPAQRLGSFDNSLPNNGWLVNGMFTEVDEGNRLKRAVIGFGQGSTQMMVQIGVSDLASKNPQAPFIIFGTIKDPSKLPGAVVTMNPYVAGAKFVMEKNASSKDVKNTAKQIVAEILKYKQKFSEQRNAVKTNP
ncbi:MAG: DUF4410 domain-containing protein [Methylococcaceae bacterium]|jgi:Domain of unknown function (DUF4410)